jgi:hypothetical protein
MSHSITLSWTPSIDLVDGYNVYRSETQGAESTETVPLNPTLIPAATSTYIDTTILVGHAYFYEVRAIAGTTQSVVSNEVVSAAILPFPPTNLVITATV